MRFSTTRALGACHVVLALLATPVQADDFAPPLSLRQAIDAALLGNPGLQSFAFDFRMQDARAQQAALRPAPELSLSAENLSGSGQYRAGGQAEYTLAISQVLELGEKRGARIATAQAERDSVKVERQIRQLDVLAEVTRRFITTATRQEQLKLDQRAVELAQHTVDGATRRVKAAKSPHAELDRARIALDRAKLAERSSAVELDTARKQLAASWGETQTVIGGRVFGEVKADLFELPPETDYANLLAQLKSNPDFLKFASESRLRDAELRMASSLRRPDVTVGLGIRRLQGSRDQALVTSLSMPLFSGQRAGALVAEAQARKELLDSEQHSAMVKAQATLYELHRQLGRAVLEAGTLKTDILPRTQEAMSETEYAYQRGRFSYLELVDAQREFLAVQAALIETAANAHILRAEIERLTGAPLGAQ